MRSEQAAPQARVRGVLRAVLAAVVVAGMAIVLPATQAGATPASITTTSMTPATGFLAGGVSTTITGVGFSQAGTITVSFGTKSATGINVVSDTTLTMTVPAGTSAGAVTVTVTLTPSSGPALVAANLSYTYLTPPAITVIVPTQGPEAGGTTVKVTGTNLSPVAGSTTTAKFGSNSATVSGVTNTGLSAVSPAGTGTQNVTVTVTLPAADGSATATSNGLAFKYIPAPVVTSISPASGSPAGGQDVTITGANFQAGAHVEFGPSDGTTSLKADTPASPFSVVSSTDIQATTPAGIPGATNVVVVNPDNQFGALKSANANHYAFTGSAPTITTVSPATGTSLGGTAFTISGTGFLAGASVAFRDTGDTSPPTAPLATVSANGTQITGTTPARAAATVTVVDIVVTNPGGGTVTLTGGYTYVAAAAPTVAATVSPATGASLGATPVTITGTNFVSGASVTFGGAAAPFAAVLSSTKISLNTPAHAAGTVDVVVVNPDHQTATATGAFTYTAAAAPTITSIAPSTGAGGTTTITITGTGFANTNGAATNAVTPAIVSVGTPLCNPNANPVTNPSATVTCLTPVSPNPLVVSATSIVGVVPNAPGGAVTVTVANPDGQTATTTFTYTGATGAPTLTSISPTTGPSLGDTSVTLSGTNFVNGAVVSFGGNNSPAATTLVNAAGTSVTAVTPPGTYGLVDVTVTNPPSPGGQVATLKNAFTFTTSPQPTITSITPNTGPGGTSVTITGTGFANTNGAATNSDSPAVVTIGGQPMLPLPASPPTVPPTFSTTPVVVSSTSIVGTVPVEPGGAVDVAITNPDGQGVIKVGGYTYPTDSTPPTTTASGLVGTSPYTLGTFATGAVTVTLTAVDNTGGSGVASITYSTTGAQAIASTTVPVTTPASVSFHITANGVTTVTFFATDLAGNAGTPQTATVKVDSVKPTITTTATIPATGGGTTAYASGTPTNQNVTVSFLCADGVSGVGTLTATSSTGSTTTKSGTNPLAVTVTSVGTAQSVTATCTDLAGNANSATFSGITIARTAPNITVSATTAGGVAYTAGVFTNKSVTVVFTCTPLSTSDQIASVTPPVQVDGPTLNQTVPGTCVDTAGNSSTVTFGTASAGIDIDLTRPVASASATTTDNSGQNVPYVAGTFADHAVTVTFSCTDSGTVASGVASVAAPIVVTFQGETSGVSGGCTDVAGNAANPPAFFGPILVDTTAPTCTVVVNPNPIKPANKLMDTVSATVTVNDAFSGPNGFVLVSVTSNNAKTAATDITGFTPGTASTLGQLRATTGRVYTFKYQGFDNAGNTSAMCTAKVTVS